MKIKILESAKEDLKDGFHFYEFQERGIGNYFLSGKGFGEWGSGHSNILR